MIPHRGVDHRQQGVPLKNRPRANPVFWKSGRPFVGIRRDAIAAISIRIVECDWSRCNHHGGGLLRLGGRVLYHGGRMMLLVLLLSLRRLLSVLVSRLLL